MKEIYFVIIAAVVLVILAIILLLKKEKYNEDSPSCNEAKPIVRFKNLYYCNACSLSCNSKESKENCSKCMYDLNTIIPSVL